MPTDDRRKDVGVWVKVCVVGLLFSASSVTARGEYRLGGPEGNPWQTALSFEGGGEYVVVDGSGAQTGIEPVRVTPFGAGTDTLLDFSGASIRARYIDPAVNIALTDPEAEKSKVPLIYVNGEISVSRGGAYGCFFYGQHAGAIKRMVDGDPTTAQFRPFLQDPLRNPGIGKGNPFLDAMVVDFGADVPINRIRFYPRLSKRDDAQLIDGLTNPKLPVEAFGEDSFVDNFLAWYDVRVGNNSIPYQNGPCGRMPGRRWVQKRDPWLELLRSTRENLNEVVDYRFPTRNIRYLTIEPFPLRDWEIAELEIYGEGYVPQTVYLSQILDFGRPVTWGKIRWSGDLPDGTRVEIRSRTGHTPDPQRYFVESINGNLEEVSRADYDRVEVLAQLPPNYDAANWSFWSSPYDFETGLRDSGKVANSWEDGTPLLSPGPSRYLQLHIRLFAAFAATPRLDQVSLQFGEAPSARNLVGEVWPVVVNSFDTNTFNYVVRPAFGPGDIGFDRVEILTHTRVTEVRGVNLDGVPVPLDVFVPQVWDDRVVVGFPPLGGEADSFKQLEVVFDVPVLRFGTEFSGWVYSSGDPDRIRQSIIPGNATYRYSGDVLAVQTPVGGALLRDVVVGPNPFTPNGDGINELLHVAYKLREVTVSRPVRLRIFDLSGREVVELNPKVTQSGVFLQQWDGRDDSGSLVPPGAYTYQLTLEAEAAESYIGSFAIVY